MGNICTARAIAENIDKANIMGSTATKSSVVLKWNLSSGKQLQKMTAAEKFQCGKLCIWLPRVNLVDSAIVWCKLEAALGGLYLTYAGFFCLRFNIRIVIEM
jgi:hypothetical protein